MKSVALPLRVTAQGKLEEGDAFDALVALIRAMSSSPATAWRHAPWFGLLEHFEGANLGLQEQVGIRDALNLALDRLGVDWARVESVGPAPGATPHERAFRLTFVGPDGRSVHRSLTDRLGSPGRRN
jgi:hypothetical protein